MSTYNLLGRSIQFSKAEDDFYQLQYFYSQTENREKTLFDTWYAEQSNASNVINNCPDYFKKTITEKLLFPLYNNLAKKYNLYGISKNEFIEACIDISSIWGIRNNAIEIYNDIQEQLELEIEEREENEEWRRAGQISFGIGDSLKNAASNAVHGVAKASGNTGSRERAEQNKTKLYNDLKKPLWEALSESIKVSAENYMEFINQKIPCAIYSNFSRDSSNAYLTNAENLPKKREELLVEAFKACPWNQDLYSYIFKEYESERKNLIAISKFYHVDLTDDIESIFKSLYTNEAKNSESLAIQVKSQIKEIMIDWGVSTCLVIDEIENDCLKRIVKDVENATEDECNKMKTTVETYDALNKNKVPFLEQIKKRIETIWAAEDGEIFDNYFLSSNILSSHDMQEGIRLVKEKGRTDDAKKYIQAFETCGNKSNVSKARQYHAINKNGLGIVKYFGWILISGFIVASFIFEAFSWFPIIIGAIYQIYIHHIKRKWESITLNGKIIHTALEISKAEYEKLSIDATSIDLKATNENSSIAKSSEEKTSDK